MYCSSTPFSFVKGRFALKPLTNSGVKLFCVQANCPTSCIDTGSCHKCLCFLDYYDIILLRLLLGDRVMKKTSILLVVLYVIYLFIIFNIFYHDKKILVIFASIGLAIFAATIKRIKNSDNE